MPFWNKFPYTDFHELNLDWIINEIKKIGINVDDFIKNYKNPVITDDVNDITNTNYVYLYVGRDTTQYLNRHWYYFNPSTEEWEDGGLYGSAIIDDEFSTTSHNPVENKVITEKLNEIDDDISAISRNSMQANSTPSFYETSLDKMCQLYLPENHTSQAIEYYDGYLYVFHHINDSTENKISKYRWSDIATASVDDIVNPVDTLTINHNTHGNSLSAYNGYLILADVVSGIRSVTIINTNTFTASNRIELLSGTITFDSCGVITNELGTFFVVFLEHVGMMYFYRLVDGYFILTYAVKRTFMNGAYPADIHMASRIYTLHSSYNISTEYSGLAVYTPDGFPIGICKFSNIPNSIEVEGLTKLSGDPNIYITDKNANIYKTNPSVEFPFTNTYSNTKSNVLLRLQNYATFFTSFPSDNMLNYVGNLVQKTGGVMTRYPLNFARNEFYVGAQNLWINIVWAQGNIYENVLINGNYGDNGSIIKEYNGVRVKVDYTFHPTYLEITEVTLYDGNSTRTLTGGNLYSAFYVRVSGYNGLVTNPMMALHTSYENIFQ